MGLLLVGVLSGWCFEVDAFGGLGGAGVAGLVLNFGCDLDAGSFEAA